MANGLRQFSLPEIGFVFSDWALLNAIFRISDFDFRISG
jgi:hypothetical protein